MRAEPSPRIERRHNRRVHRIDKRAWMFKRRARFNHSVRVAGELKALRTALGVTQAELARAAHVSQAAITQRESGFYSWNAADADTELAKLKRLCVRLAGIQ